MLVHSSPQRCDLTESRRFHRVGVAPGVVFGLEEVGRMKLLGLTRTIKIECQDCTGSAILRIFNYICYFKNLTCIGNSGQPMGRPFRKAIARVYERVSSGSIRKLGCALEALEAGYLELPDW